MAKLGKVERQVLHALYGDDALDRLAAADPALRGTVLGIAKSAAKEIRKGRDPQVAIGYAIVDYNVAVGSFSETAGAEAKEAIRANEQAAKQAAREERTLRAMQARHQATLDAATLERRALADLCDSATSALLLLEKSLGSSFAEAGLSNATLVLTQLADALGRRPEASRARAQARRLVNAPAGELRTWAYDWKKFAEELRR